jgi:osmotically inducible lipoprotein OsmB
MKKIVTAVAAGALALSVTACNTPGERAAGGAVIGGLAGAAIGGAATGRTSGALAGAAVGAAGGAVVGAATAPQGGACPPGYYLASDGYCYPRPRY